MWGNCSGSISADRDIELMWLEGVAKIDFRDMQCSLRQVVVGIWIKMDGQ